jgi:hypothetical protein
MKNCGITLALCLHLMGKAQTGFTETWLSMWPHLHVVA